MDFASYKDVNHDTDPPTVAILRGQIAALKTNAATAWALVEKLRDVLRFDRMNTEGAVIPVLEETDAALRAREGVTDSSLSPAQ